MEEGERDINCLSNRQAVVKEEGIEVRSFGHLRCKGGQGRRDEGGAVRY